MSINKNQSRKCFMKYIQGRQGCQVQFNLSKATWNKNKSLIYYLLLFFYIAWQVKHYIDKYSINYLDIYKQIEMLETTKTKQYGAIIVTQHNAIHVCILTALQHSSICFRSSHGLYKANAKTNFLS